jgi:cytochrome c nitrite reductase small subunit
LSHPGVILRIILALLVGIFVGVGAFTFGYGEGFSYFSTDPRACVNCHIMREQFDSWQKSSHHAVAGCIDCHLPHSILPGLVAKADNGWRHSWAFTFDNFHEPIQIIPRNQRILQNNCVACHGQIVHEMLGGREDMQMQCVHCHADVGHGARR